VRRGRQSPFLRARIDGSAQLGAEIRTARAFGVSRKRFFGWEPTETHERFDADGNLIERTVITREPEWDDETRDWALALTAAEDNQCPVCGGPRDECTDPNNEFKWVGIGPYRCHRGTASATHQANFFGQGKQQPRYAEALLWGVKSR